MTDRPSNKSIVGSVTTWLCPPASSLPCSISWSVFEHLNHLKIVANITQEYPFSRGFTHIKSADPYDSPDFDAGFMNDERDMAPMVWGYIKSRETARRMSSYAGEVANMHPHFAYNSAARTQDLDLATTKAYAGTNHLSAGIQHGKLFMMESDSGGVADFRKALGPSL